MVLDWPKRLHIALGVARGLCYMHDDCVPAEIHRDVKSSNVLLDSDFNAKIANFGLARILAKESELNSMSTVAGSFGYMAPELTTGKEASDGNESLSLAEWAWQRAQCGAPIVDALDNEVNEPSYINDMTNVFKLGLWCTRNLPTDRPSMQEVCQMLLRCSVAAAVKTEAEKNSGDVTDHFPLLKVENV
ncbi:MDIS1-interacting receptor like kinase 1-like [Bidens hawaiensis]|uniref:MDIS1-interacting receptor like kinase 1-like n=1 Tax=Bidens hawaiensis TaxID=980011 RepID=UPI00404ADA79